MAWIPPQQDAPESAQAFDLLAALPMVSLFSKGEIVTYLSDGTPGNETAVSHRIGVPPAYWIVLSQDAPGSVYQGTTANDGGKAYFRSDAGNVTYQLAVLA